MMMATTFMDYDPDDEAWSPASWLGSHAKTLYNAYLTYLKVDDHLRESACPPPCGAAVAVRWYYADDCGDCGSDCHW